METGAQVRSKNPRENVQNIMTIVCVYIQQVRDYKNMASNRSRFIIHEDSQKVRNIFAASNRVDNSEDSVAARLAEFFAKSLGPSIIQEKFQSFTR